ncbi:MAG: 3-hydroxyanthranilate 3,4-dioxygenase [Cytophagales bacterium]|nr:MAG: 3-hydroxyanthranilate 3,4-dioxygenase [Cytophagales bacterium]
MSINVLNLMQWVEEHKDILKPPVGNKEIYPGGDMIIMVVAGPNERKDYHYNETPEFFLQLKGDIKLKIIENNEFKEIAIKEGDIYLLNAGIPHSPQRPAGTIGLVIEERRKENHTDGFQWYCDECHNKLHEEYFKLTDIVKQLPEVFARFNNNDSLHTCKNCGATLKIPLKK